MQPAACPSRLPPSPLPSSAGSDLPPRHPAPSERGSGGGGIASLSLAVAAVDRSGE